MFSSIIITTLLWNICFQNPLLITHNEIRYFMRGYATPKQYNWINLENPEGASKNVQSKETGNIGYTRQRQSKQTKQNFITICVGHHYTQTNRKNVNKTCVLLQTTSKHEHNIVYMWKS